MPGEARLGRAETVRKPRRVMLNHSQIEVHVTPHEHPVHPCGNERGTMAFLPSTQKENVTTLAKGDSHEGQPKPHHQKGQPDC